MARKLKIPQQWASPQIHGRNLMPQPARWRLLVPNPETIARLADGARQLGIAVLANLRQAARYEDWSLRTRILGLVLAVVVPLNLVIAAVIFQITLSIDARQHATLQYTAHSIGSAVEAELGKYSQFARALAQSPLLLSGDREAFKAEATRILPREDAWLFVSSLSGQQEFNTVASVDSLPMQSAAGLTTQTRALATRAVQISTILQGPIKGTWVIWISVPVLKNDEPWKILTIVLHEESFLDLLNARTIPRNWLVGIADQEGRFVARVPSHAGSVGQLASVGWRNSMPREGIDEFKSREGEVVVNANAHVAAAGWTVGVAVMKSDLRAASWRAARWSMLLGGAISILSIALSAVVARRITEPLALLRRQAGNLVEGRAGDPPRSTPPEIGELWRTIAEAGVQRRLAEGSKKVAHDSFRHLVENSPFGIYAVDADFRLVQVSQGAQKVFATVRPLLGRDFAEVLRILWGEPFASEAIARFRHTLETGEPYHAVRTIERRKDIGETEAYDWKIERVALSDGRLGVVCHFYDLSERQRMEAELRESEERYRATFENAAVGVAELTAEGRFLQVNRRFGDILGYAQAELIGRTFPDVTHPADLDRNLEELARMRAGQIEDFSLEKRYIHKDGAIIWCALSVAAVRGSDGQLARLVSVVQDISQRKEADARLSENAALFRAMFEISSVGKAQLALEDGRFVRVNAALASITGYDESELLARTLRDITHPEDVARDRGALGRLAQELTYDAETRLVRKDGSPIWVRITANVIQGGDPKPPRATAVIQDVSAQKRAEERQKILFQELVHRGRNLLTVIQSIASRSLAGDRSLREARTVFSGRLHALASSYGALTGDNTELASLAEIVGEELRPFGARAHVGGKDVMLPSKAAQTMALVVHELATNAAKHGALTAPAGYVDVSWSVATAEDGPRFRFAWREHGGPRVEPPVRQGFGTTLITVVAGAEFGCEPVLDYAPEGLRYVLDAPLDKVAAASFAA